MLKNPQILNDTLLEYLKSQLVITQSKGVVIHLDGTLMSLVNICLAQQLLPPFSFKVIACVFNQNKYSLSHLMSLVQRLKVPVEVKDLSKDLDTLAFFKQATNQEEQIAVRKRFIDLSMNIDGDKNNYLPLSNLSYSQWCINFPHKCYQGLEQVHLLNRLYHSELKDFAYFLELPESIIERDPSHFLFRGQTDSKTLGFTYEELEDFLRNAQADRNHTDTKIRKTLASDNRGRFLNPTIQRPSIILG